MGNFTRLLIDNGANVNLADTEGWTPLHWAAEKGHYEILPMLLFAGADVNAKDLNGLTPADAAPAGGKQHAAEFLDWRNPWSSGAAVLQ